MRLKWIAGGLAGAIVLAVGAFTLWFFVLREEGPEEVSTESALEALRTATPDSESSATTAPGATGTPSATDQTPTTAAEPGSGNGGIEGTWTVSTELESFVGYRVDEELAGIGGVTAVGRTPAVEGSVIIEGLTATSGNVVAQLSQLRSQESLRDGQLRTQGIQWGTFPTSEFVLTAPVQLPETIESGETVQVTLGGELTLHGVTNAVEVPAEVTLQDGVLVVVGQIEILFGDYDIEEPRSQRVVGIEDHGIMELQLFFTK